MNLATSNPTLEAPRITLAVVTGEHSHPIPAGLGELVREALKARGVTGNFKLRMGPTVQGTNSMSVLHVVRVTARGTLELRCKPGGNDTARVCWLSVESGALCVEGRKYWDVDGKSTQAEKLAEVLREQRSSQGGVTVGAVKGAGMSFTSNRSNVQAALKVLCVSGAADKFIFVDKAKKALTESGVGPGMTSASWGQVFGAMSRHGMLEVKRHNEALTAVKVPAKWVPHEMRENGTTPVVVHLSHVPVGALKSAMPMPTTVGREGLVAWLRQLAGVEEGLLSQLVGAEERERAARALLDAAKSEADVVREQLAKAGQAVGAAKLLLGMME